MYGVITQGWSGWIMKIEFWTFGHEDVWVSWVSWVSAWVVDWLARSVMGEGSWRPWPFAIPHCSILVAHPLGLEDETNTEGAMLSREAWRRKNSWGAWPGWTITAGMGWGRDREERAAIVQIVQIVQIVEGKQELGEEGRGGCRMQYNLVESAEERDILLSVGSWHHHLPASKIVNSASGGRSTFLFWRSSFKTRDFAKRGYLRFWNFYPDLASQR